MLKNVKYILAAGLLALGYTKASHALSGPSSFTCTASLAKASATDTKKMAFAKRCLNEVHLDSIKNFSKAFVETNCGDEIKPGLEKFCKKANKVHKTHLAKAAAKKAEKAAREKEANRVKREKAKAAHEASIAKQKQAEEEEATAQKEAKAAQAEDGEEPEEVEEDEGPGTAAENAGDEE